MPTQYYENINKNKTFTQDYQEDGNLLKELKPNLQHGSADIRKTNMIERKTILEAEALRLKERLGKETPLKIEKAKEEDSSFTEQSYSLWADGK